MSKTRKRNFSFPFPGADGNANCAHMRVTMRMLKFVASGVVDSSRFRANQNLTLRPCWRTLEPSLLHSRSVSSSVTSHTPNPTAVSAPSSPRAPLSRISCIASKRIWAPESSTVRHGLSRLRNWGKSSLPPKGVWRRFARTAAARCRTSTVANGGVPSLVRRTPGLKSHSKREQPANSKTSCGRGRRTCPRLCVPVAV